MTERSPRDAPRQPASAAAVVLLTAAVAAAYWIVGLAWRSGLCGENVPDEGLRATVCTPATDAGFLCAVVVPPVLVLIAGIARRPRRQVHRIAIALLAIAAAWFVGVALVASG